MSAETTETEDAPAKSSMLAGLIFLVVAALVSGGAGFAVGQFVFAPMIVAPGSEDGGATTAAGAIEGDADATGDQDMAGEAGNERPPIRVDYGGLSIVELDPITTNIAVPAEVWVRAELSVAVKGEVDPVLFERVQSDMLAYFRTVRLHSLATPSGFQHIVTDLSDRAALRSEGQIKKVFVKALLVE